MNTQQAQKLLGSVSEEDLFSHGVMFNNMDPEGSVFWRVRIYKG